MESMNFILIVFITIFITQVVMLVSIELLVHLKEVVSVDGSKLFKYRIVYKKVVDQFILSDKSSGKLLSPIDSKIYYLSRSFLDIPKNRLLFSVTRKLVSGEHSYILIPERDSIVYNNYRICKYLDSIDLSDIDLYKIYDKNSEYINNGKEYFINYISNLLSFYKGSSRALIIECYDSDIVYYRLISEDINYRVVDYITSSR